MQDLVGMVMAITGGAAGIGLAVARTARRRRASGSARLPADAIDAALSDLGEQARGYTPMSDRPSRSTPPTRPLRRSRAGWTQW